MCRIFKLKYISLSPLLGQGFEEEEQKKSPTSPSIKQPKNTKNVCKVNKIAKKYLFCKILSLYTITNLCAILENMYGK